MKIKTKLTLGVGLLFILIVLLAAVGTSYINALSNDTKNILVANYNTLEYSRNILLVIDEKVTSEKFLKIFEDNLIKQEHNITEIGEKEITELLSQHFEQFKQEPQNISIQLLIRKDVYDLMKLNMDAIVRKSNIAEQTAHRATLWIAITGTLCFLIAFTLLINFPGHIANPIRKLTGSIKEIANKNYNERLHFESNDEFGELATAFNTMAAKLEEYDSSNLSRILFQKKRIETLINNMPNPIIGFDEKMKILFANNEALKILNIKAENLIGKIAQDVSLTNDLMRSLTKEIIERKNETDKQNKEPLKIYADDKESYFEKEIIRVTITPTGETLPKHIGDVIILQNITPFKELDFAKSNFIANISHEFKTPLSSILMSLKLLDDERIGSISDEQKKLILNIKEDCERLLKITGELLNISQLETGNIQLSIQQNDPHEILRYAVDAVKFQAEQKQISLVINTDEKLMKVKADMEKTAWVLINILTNAIRYSSEKSNVIIEVKNNSDKIIFSVKDFGKGIDKRYLSKIFDRYFQIPGSSKSGTGLGLAISKEFIEAQGGSIYVESEIGEGSNFSFSLCT